MSLAPVHGERGITLAELLVGGALAVITLSIVVTWIITTSRVEIDQAADLEILNQMRLGRELMVKELRFADGVLPSASANTVDVWIDRNGNGAGPDSVGEHVTWQIASGALVRYEDGNPATSRIWLESVIEPSSQLSVSGGVATIELAVQVPQGRTSAVRTLKTRVTVRNTLP